MRGISNYKHYKKTYKECRIVSCFETLFSKIKKYLDSLNLKDKHIILAISWWADSLLMSIIILLYYHKQHLNTDNIHIAHCNHKIRKESEDEAKAMKIFFSWLDFHLYERDTNDKNKDENSLRIWRYSQFSALQKETNSSYIFLGHHLNDRIESTILNLMRWANIKWFLNMHHIQEHPLLPKWCKICRPLLSIPKWDILWICYNCKIKYFEDKTNTDISISKRNRVRNQILEPLLYWWKNDVNKFLDSFSNIYNEIERLENVDKTFNKKDFLSMPIHPVRNAKFSYKRIWDILNIKEKDLVNLWDDLWIQTQKTTILIKEWREWLNTWKNSYKYLDWTYFFIHEKELYIIKADKEFWNKKDKSEKVEINKIDNFIFYWFELEIPREELIWSIVRLPDNKDKFNGKNRNRWALNQKIPMRWRNRIPLSIKNGEVIHMRKNIWKK